MAASVALGTFGATAVAAYLNAKFHLGNDIRLAGLSPKSRKTAKFIEKKVQQKRLLNFDLFEDQALNNGHRTFLIFEGQSWTYKEFFDRIVATSNWLRKQHDIQKDDIVAIYGTNTPEYLAMWFAVESLAAVPSLLNCNLTGQGLFHCVKLCKSRFIFYDEDSTKNVGTCEAEFRDAGIEMVKYTMELINQLNDFTPVPEEPRQAVELLNHGTLLYTSGTTGLPKATIMTRQREILIGFVMSKYLKLKEGDIMYTVLPLYHGAAHGLCMTPAIHAGSAVALGRRFTHRTFWPEVRASKANILQYVGELCRYLVNAPPSPMDKQNNVRMAWGNGMRPDIWEPFRQRFGIETINELYAATDTMGSSSLNPNRGEFSKHAIGIRGLIWDLMAGNQVKHVKIDPDSQDILKDDKGRPIVCSKGEPGEEIYWIDPNVPQTALYYDNDEAMQKRILRNVFKKGDMWFRSGDMLRHDRDGRVYFVDRLGDTFRWRSENVSTNEVSDVVAMFPQIEETNVVGVLVPRSDGRCGCAAIVLKKGVSEEDFDFKGLAQHCLQNLPRYAVPGFIRITKLIEYTGTFKIQKGRIRREGVDPKEVSGGDKIYWLPQGGDKYVPFKKEDYAALKAGKARI